MGRVLRRTVVAGGVTYPAGTAETSALKKAVSNPRAWEGEPDPEPAPRKRAAAKPASSPAPPETPEEPPRGGEGSTEDAWRAYASELGVEVPEGAGRDDIVALVDARTASE